MEHAKKMILIEPRVLESMQQQQQETRQDYDTTSRDLKETDQSMQAILESDGHVQDKANAYQQALWGFLNRFDQYKDRPLGRVQLTRDSIPERNTTTKKEQAGEEAEVESAKPSSPLSWIEQDVVESVPKSLKTKAERLLQRIKLDPEVKWNNLGELEYRGQLIKNSNLTDLVNDVLRKRKNSREPLGWETFADVLHRLNVPQELIGNPTRWSYMRKRETLAKTPEKKNKINPKNVALSSIKRRPLLDDNDSFETPPNETPSKWSKKETPTKWRKKQLKKSERKRKKSIKTDLTWVTW